MIKIFKKKRANPSQTPKEPSHQSDIGQGLANKGLANTDQGQKKEINAGHRRIKTDLLIHDLKVPLAVIEAGIHSLLKRTEKYGPLTEKQKKVLVRVLRNTKVTQRLVIDALELGRSRKGIVHLTNFVLSDFIERSLVEIFDLADTETSERIRSCADLTGMREALEKRGILLIVDEALWCQEVCQDQAKLIQILRNLLDNALKYRKSRVELEIDRKDDCLLILVTDDGEGIPSVYHKKIFESYFQMDIADSCPVRGHGLGLAGVMALVEDMGGELLLYSDEGKGAKFSIKIPLESSVG